jgi:Bacterial Ig domain
MVIAVLASAAAGLLVPVHPSADVPVVPVPQPGCGQLGGVLVNGSFENPLLVSTGSWTLAPDDGSSSSVQGWHTTDPTHVIEVWNNLAPDGGPTFVPPQGVQSVELNANNPSELYQDVATVPGVVYRYSFWHRGRLGTDTADVLIGPTTPGEAPSGGSETTTTGGEGFSDGNTAWTYHSGLYTTPAGQTTTRFGINSVSAAGNGPSVGNEVDFATFSPQDCPVVGLTTAGHQVSGNVLGVDQQLAGGTVSSAVPPSYSPPVITDGFTVHPNGDWTFVPPVGFSGLATTAFGVKDPPGVSQLWVTVKPVAADAAGTTPLNTVLNGPSVLAGDTGSNLLAAFDSQPAHGVVTMAADGTYVYTPTHGFSGVDHFMYRVTDDSGQTAIAKVVLHVTAPPNLGVTIDGPATTVYSGQTAVYTIGYSNKAGSDNLIPVASTGVVLRAAVPAHTVVNAAASDPGWTCEAHTGPSECVLAVGALGGGLSGSARFAVTLLPELPAGTHSFTTVASIADDGTHDQPTGTPVATTVPATTASNAPNLVVWQSGPPTVFAGQVVTYNIDFSNVFDTLNNPAPSDATGVVITDVVPPLTTFSTSGSAPGWSCPNGAPPGTVCTLPIGSVPAGGTDPQPFAVKVGGVAPGTSGTQNQASIADDGTHGVATGSKSAPPATSSAANPPNFAISVSAAPSTVHAGQPDTFTVHYANTTDPGNTSMTSAATAVTVTETVPDGMRFTRQGSTAGWSCADGASAGSDCTIVIGTVNPGTSGWVAFIATPTSPVATTHSVSDTASIQDDGTHGPATGTQTASTTVTVEPAAATAPSTSAGPAAAPPGPTSAIAPSAPGGVSGTTTGPPSGAVRTATGAGGGAYDYGTPGGAGIVNGGGPSAFDVVNADPHHARSPLDVALVRPDHLATDATTLSSNLLLSILVLILIGLSAELFNRTWITHHDVMRRAVHRLFGPTRKILHEEFGFIRGLVGVGALLLFAMTAALIESLLDPHAAFDRATIALWLGLVIAFLAITVCWEVPEMIWLRRRTPQMRTLRLLPEALPVAGLCVLLSRVTGLHPGYMFGILAALTIVRGQAPREEVGKAMALCAATVVALATVAYLLTGVVADAVQASPGGPQGAPFILMILDAALPSAVMASLGCLVFGLLPLHMMRGAELAAWSKTVWATFYGFGTFALLALVIHPSGGLTELTRPLVLSLIPYAVVAVLALAFYLAFRLRAPATSHAEPVGSARP